MLTIDQLARCVSDVRAIGGTAASIVPQLETELFLMLVCGYVGRARQGAAKAWYTSSVVEIRVKYAARCALTGEWIRPAPGGTFAKWIRHQKKLISNNAWHNATNAQIRRMVSC